MDFGGPGENRTPASAMRMRRFTTELQAQAFMVGTPRIELGLHAPEACVLPAYSVPYLTTYFSTFKGNFLLVSG